MSKYGPAWVWFATGQSLGQVTPFSIPLRRGCQPQSAASIHAILAGLQLCPLAIGIGVACGLGLDKAKVDVNALKS
jgi:hypothetical protein